MSVTVNSTDTLASSQLIDGDDNRLGDYWVNPPGIPGRTGLVDLPTITPTSPDTIPYPHVVYGPDKSRDEVVVRNIETGESMRVSRNIFESTLLQAFRGILRDGSQEGKHLAERYQREGMTPELKEAVREVAMTRLGFVEIATTGDLLKIKEAAAKLNAPDEPIKDIYYD